MTCLVRYFAQLRERLGAEAATMELPPGARAHDLFARLFADPQERERWQRYTRVAVNRVYVPSNTELCEGDEVALIPPVAGG